MPANVYTYSILRKKRETKAKARFFYRAPPPAPAVTSESCAFGARKYRLTSQDMMGGRSMVLAVVAVSVLVVR